MRYLHYFFIIVLIGFGISFACLNAERVTLNYYIGEHIISLPLLLAIVLFIGVLLGFLVSLPSIFRAKNQNRRLCKRLKLIEQEVSNLRVIPILDNNPE